MFYERNGLFIYENPQSEKLFIYFGNLDEQLIFQIEKYQLPITLISIKEPHYQNDFSPWSYKQFGGQGNITIEKISDYIKENKQYDNLPIYTLGYSLGGLLALYSLTIIKELRGCACVSGSLWYPGLLEYLNNHPIYNREIYLSLGNKEYKTRHPLMKNIEKDTKNIWNLLAKNNKTFFKFTKGNHFENYEERIIEALLYLTKTAQKRV